MYEIVFYLTPILCLILYFCVKYFDRQSKSKNILIKILKYTIAPFLIIILTGISFIGQTLDFLIIELFLISAITLSYIHCKQYIILSGVILISFAPYIYFLSLFFQPQYLFSTDPLTNRFDYEADEFLEDYRLMHQRTSANFNYHGSHNIRFYKRLKYLPFIERYIGQADIGPYYETDLFKNCQTFAIKDNPYQITITDKCGMDTITNKSITETKTIEIK